MLTGKQLNAARAKKAGLIDLVVDANALERTVPDDDRTSPFLSATSPLNSPGP
jgi:enoyl-CoA hydratase/carnithine racemase